MTTIFRDDIYPTFGHEVECANGGDSRNWSISRWQDELNDAGYTWVKAVHDGTVEVDVEFIIPPFPLCDEAKQDIANLFSLLKVKVLLLAVLSLVVMFIWGIAWFKAIYLSLIFGARQKMKL